MAGIISSLFGDEKPTGAPVENTGNAEVEEEREYCFFLKLSESQMEELARTVEQKEREFIYEGKLGRNKEVRIRKKLTADFEFDKATIESKYREGDASIEIVNKLAEATFDRLIPSCDLVSARVRFDLDVDGLEWEVDVFLLQDFAEPRFCNWVKVELEVDKFDKDDILNLLPFTQYEQLIDAKNATPEDKNQIDLLWNVIYNYICAKTPFAIA